MQNSDRRYDIDWLRVIAIALLLIYHAAIVFQPWGVFFGFIVNKDSFEELWIPMSMLNLWRIPILFYVSGMGVCFAMQKRTWKQLILERSRRILIPLIFGMLTIVPIHILLFQAYYSQDLKYFISRGHLWFLGNIFAYVVLLLPLFYYLKKHDQGLVKTYLKKAFKSPFGILIVILAVVIETFLINPSSFEVYVNTLHGFFLGLIAFLFGFLFVYSGEEFWITMKRWRIVYLTLACGLFIVRYSVYDLNAPSILKAIESSLWVFTVLGFCYTYLNYPSRTLKYLSKAAYPIYIVHMVFLYLGCLIILPTSATVVSKYIFVTVFSFLGSFIFYEIFIRRIKIFGVFFGVSTTKKN